MKHTPRPRLAWVFAALWGIALLTHASGLFTPMHADYSTWIRVARDWAAGAPLYGTAYDNKQPTLFLLVRLIDSDWPAVSCYLAETLLAAVAGTVLFAALWRTLPRCAYLAPPLLIAWSGTSITFVNGQTTEAPAMWCDVIALSCCALASRASVAFRSAKGRPFAERKATLTLAFVGGTFFFLMSSLRIPCLLHGMAYVPFLMAIWRTCGRRPALWTLAAFSVGFAIPLAALLVHGSLDGYHGRLIDVTRRNFEYGALDRVPLAASLVESGKVLVRMAADQSLAVFLVVVTFVAVRSANGRAADRMATWRRVALLWLIAAYAGTFPGGRHYHHYYHVLWGPLAVLASLGLSHVWRLCRRRSSGRLLAGVAVAVTVLLSVAVNLYACGRWAAERRTPEDLSRPRNAIAAAEQFVGTAADPRTPAAVYVWLDYSELYWRLDRPRVSYSVPHVLPDELLDEWATEVLKRDRVIVVVDAAFFRRKSGHGAFERFQSRLAATPAIRLGPPGNEISIYDLRGDSSKKE